jgi:hypothetical protein
MRSERYGKLLVVPQQIGGFIEILLVAFIASDREVAFESGRRRVDICLAKGNLMLDGADIYADGAFIGNAPANLKLPAGKHTIRVSQSDYKDWSREITVQAGAESRLIATLEKK